MNINEVRFLILSAPFFITGLWMISAQRDYLKLYKEKKHPKVPVVQEDFVSYFYSHPIKWFIIAPKILIVVLMSLFQKYEDKQLSMAQSRLRFRLVILILVLIICFVISISV